MALILLAEDNEFLRNSSKLWLEVLGYVVRLARNGKEALALCQTETFDLVITDDEMPIMSGQALVHELRRIKPDLKIILRSAHAEPPDHGANAFVRKGDIEPTDLEKLIKSLLQA